VFDKLNQIETITTNSTGDDEIISNNIVSWPFFSSTQFESVFMPVKPSYHELEQTIGDLKKNIISQKLR